VDFNLATTVSLCAAATCLSLAVLGAYLGRAPSSRHFHFAALAGFAAAAYCTTNAVLAGRMSVGVTTWAGRTSIFLASAYGAAWLAFLAAWERRRLTRFERGIIVASLVAGVVSLVPDVAVVGSVTERTVGWIGVTYRDPDVGPLATPLLSLAYVEQIVAAVAALRMSRRQPRARVVAGALGVFCVVSVFDWLSAMHVLALPYLADPALALVFVSIGSVVMLDAAESGAKSAELERARVALAERENLAALGQLAAVVAHEVRNPVAIIFGALATLQRAAHSDEDAKLLGIVGEEAERLKQLVARLLDAVRPFELQYSRCAVSAVVRAAIAQVTTGTSVDPGEVELVPPPDDEVECDEVLLGQAIANLVQNALVASGRRAPVRVRAVVEPESSPVLLRIDVFDDGEGVAAEARPRLFTPFFTTRATGTGLGLALVKRIAGAHGGTVDYEPPAGGGATFVLRVPLRAKHGTPRRLLGDEVR
jgi:signal transduction histidine kinase